MRKRRRSTGEVLPGAFDPSKVPPYPVLTLTGADDPDNVSVDGEPITGDDAFDRALSLCAQRADELGGAVRVRGIDGEGVVWPMVVTSTGELHDLSERPEVTPALERTGLSRRSVLIGAAGLLTLGAAAVGGTIGYRAITTPEAPAPPPLFPGQGANLPVIPPAGAGTVAEWAVVINPDTQPVLLTDQRILLLTSNGALVIVDALTGQMQWSGTPDGRLDTVNETVIDGTPVLASYTDDAVTLWPLNDPSTPSPQTLTVEQGRAETVVTSSSAPLWILESQTVSYLAGNALALVEVPVPAITAGTYDGAVVAVDGTSWLNIASNSAATKNPLGGTPEGAELLHARVVGSEHLAVLWGEPEAAVMTLHHLPDGALVDQINDLDLPRTRENTEPLASPDRATWVWQNVLIQPAQQPALTGLARMPVPGGEDEAPFEVASVSDSAIWGEVDRVPTRYDVKTATTSTYDEDASLPLGEARDGSLVYMIASRLEQTSLYALPATPPAPSDGGTDS